MDEERLMVLRLLEEGKITAEEAAELLQALEAVQAVPAQPSPAPAPEQPSAEEAPTGDPWVALQVPLLERIERLFESLGGVFGDTHRFETVVEGSFEAGDRPPRVVLHSFNGRVEVHSWDRPIYRLDLVKKVRARSEDAARRLAESVGRVTRGDQFLAVESDEPVPGGMNVTCWLPQDLSYELEARTSNGRIVVEGVKAERLRLVTGNGRVEVIAGRCREGEIETSNGRVSVAGPADRLTVRTSNGRIEAIPPGGIAGGTWDLKTSNGPVMVALAPGVPVRLDLATHLGPIHLSVDHVVYEVNEKGMHSRVVAATPGAAQGSAVGLRVRTSNGPIRVEAVAAGA